MTDFLSSIDMLRQANPVEFGPAPGQPWLRIFLAKRGPTGGYASGGTFVPEVDIVELICSSQETPAGWYEAPGRRIASFLDGVAVEEVEDRPMWPPERAGGDVE